MSEALHGGRVHETARSLGVSAASILDFSANLNPLGPPAGVLQVFREVIPSQLAAYPDTEAPRLRRKLETRHGVGPENLVLGHGGAALLFLALRALAPRRVLVPIPCFQEQPRAVAACGARLSPLSMQKLRLDLDDLDRAIPGHDAVLLTNPHNPTGHTLPADPLAALMAAHPDVAFVVDEAFADAVPGLSLLPGAVLRPRTVVLRSLTKWFAMPALRIGHACADAATAGRMQELQEGWPCGQLDLLAAEAALSDPDHEARSLEALRQDAPAFRAALRNLGLEVLPGEGPFVLVRLPRACGTRWAERLRTRGILVRTCREWPGLGDDHLRLAVKPPDAQARLLQELHDLIHST